MKLRTGALLAAAGVLALTGCQDQQVPPDGDAPPPTSSRAEAAPKTEQPQVDGESGGTPAPRVTRRTTSPRTAWSKEDLAQQLRADDGVPPSSTISCDTGLPARKGANTNCSVTSDAGTAIYYVLVQPAGVTGAMAPKFTQVKAADH